MDDGCLTIIIMFIIVFVVLPFLASAWPILLPIAIIAIVLAVWHSITSGKKAKIIEAERRRDVIRKADELLSAARDYLTPCLVIDSNIWMNEAYDAFFQTLNVLCKQVSYKLILFGVQIDEISNIKKATNYGDERNKRSRIAINRIESLQKAGLLTIQPISLDAELGAYADPLLVKILSTESRKGVKCTFISDDKELRIRLREHLTNCAQGEWNVIEIDTLIPQCEQIAESFKYR